MISRLKDLFRLFTIVNTIAFYRLHLLLPSFLLPKILRFFFFLHPWTWFTPTYLSRGQRLRIGLESLGPIFVKFGQMLSTRRDVLPEDLIDELCLLQDQVPPFPSEQAVTQIELALGLPLEMLFSSFDRTPLASASVAQVHAATLLEAEKHREVIVKVLRPGILARIDRDIAWMRAIARFIPWLYPDAQRLHLPETVEEFAQTLQDECDLTHEAANASQLRRNTTNSDTYRIPEIYWPYVRSQVLVMERVRAIPIGDRLALDQAKVDLPLLAKRLIEVFFIQAFRDSFFHADMHPGNLMVDASNPHNPILILVDFGIVGSLERRDQSYLAKNFLAFFKRDYRRVAELHVESGWAPQDTRIDQFESSIRAVCEPIFERPKRDISYGQLLVRLFQTARRFQMDIQPQLTLLQKTLINIEGLGRELDPDLDLWEAGRPFLEEWLRSRTGWRAFFQQLQEHLPDWQEKMPEIPELIYQFLMTRIHARA